MTSNRSAIGARIRADIREDGEKRSVYQWVNSGGSFGANPLRQHIGLGQATSIELLEVYWPTSDTTQQFRNVGADQFVEIGEDATAYRTMLKSESEIPVLQVALAADSPFGIRVNRTDNRWDLRCR